ncbi:hypothetical protein [Pelagibaculum spongiae]|uniref:Uncharacterized protein n=1 Tax=Pelagibaculum spongiae TaxID=2080658 RepID=A0A2V1H128_9GAMM|nr:hypothetical protein [Pelagibaculum spongiae]PVZ72183.1 hypothetical protein DC094_03980 [Pelagibaculum spongiae]
MDLSTFSKYLHHCQLKGPARYQSILARIAPEERQTLLGGKVSFHPISEHTDRNIITHTSENFALDSAAAVETVGTQNFNQNKRFFPFIFKLIFLEPSIENLVLLFSSISTTNVVPNLRKLCDEVFFEHFTTAFTSDQIYKKFMHSNDGEGTSTYLDQLKDVINVFPEYSLIFKLDSAYHSREEFDLKFSRMSGRYFSKLQVYLTHSPIKDEEINFRIYLAFSKQYTKDFLLQLKSYCQTHQVYPRVKFTNICSEALRQDTVVIYTSTFLEAQRLSGWFHRNFAEYVSPSVQRSCLWYESELEAIGVTPDVNTANTGVPELMRESWNGMLAEALFCGMHIILKKLPQSMRHPETLLKLLTLALLELGLPFTNETTKSIAIQASAIAPARRNSI